MLKLQLAQLEMELGLGPGLLDFSTNNKAHYIMRTVYICVCVCALVLFLFLYLYLSCEMKIWDLKNA